MRYAFLSSPYITLSVNPRTTYQREEKFENSRQQPLTRRSFYEFPNWEKLLISQGCRCFRPLRSIASSDLLLGDGGKRRELTVSRSLHVGSPTFGRNQLDR
jgi:hypothetical protein